MDWELIDYCETESEKDLGISININGSLNFNFHSIICFILRSNKGLGCWKEHVTF